MATVIYSKKNPKTDVGYHQLEREVVKDGDRCFVTLSWRGLAHLPSFVARVNGASCDAEALKAAAVADLRKQMASAITDSAEESQWGSAAREWLPKVAAFFEVAVKNALH